MESFDDRYNRVFCGDGGTASEIAQVWQVNAGEARRIIDALIGEGRMVSREVRRKGKRCLLFRCTFGHEIAGVDIALAIVDARDRRRAQLGIQSVS